MSLRLLPGEGRPLRHRTPVHVHLGAASVTGRVLLPPGLTVEPGAAALAQIALDGDLGALNGDRFVLRDISAARTLGGGRVIDIDGLRRGAWAPGRRAEIEALDTADHGAALADLLALSETGIDLGRFARSRNIPAAAMEVLIRGRDLVTVQGPRDRRGFARIRIIALGASIVTMLEALHRAEPDNPGLTAARSQGGCRRRRAWPCAPPSISCSAKAKSSGAAPFITGGSRGSPRPIGGRPLRGRPGGPGRGRLDQPRLADLAARVDRDPEILRVHLDKFGRLGWLRRVSGHYYVLPVILAELADRARAVAAEHPQALLTVGRFREATGISRYMTMPVLTYFDARGFTTRVADGRLIRSGDSEL